MFIILRKMVVKEGHADQIIDQFSQKGIIDEQDGLIDTTIMKKKARRAEEEEVIVMFRWESEEHWKKWEKSDAHIAAHKAKRGQPKPDYLISVENERYEVQAVKKASELQR
ncbi:MAG TPA: antibiotic biosynthesis monooxygenase [Bacillota bacterium]|nr:antibiotic biosynthesis monooxygenase [Bacillota bacterium]